MSARPTWKGALKVSLVNIPIKVYPATESSEGLSFNQLHQTCQTRVTQRKWCAQCTREVPAAEIIKGFEFEKGRYVVLLEDELDAVKPPSTRVIELVQFDDVAMLHPHFVNRTYYVAPDGPVAADAFVVLREAMTRLMGIGKLAIYGREYLVAVRTHQALLMLHTLHHAAELRPVEAIDDVLLTVRAPIAEVRLARQVVAAYTRPLNLADFTDAYQADVRKLIDAKVAGEEIVSVAPVETTAVANLRVALEQSLEAVRATAGHPAKAVAAKRRKAS